MLFFKRTDHRRAAGARWPWRSGARGVVAYALAVFVLLAPSLRAVNAVNSGRVTLPDSIRSVPASTVNAASPHVARATLRAAEESAPMAFNLSLKMRNFDELEARLARGEQISPAEMAARYWPLQSDYDAAADWLKQEGFTLVANNPSHLLVSATGTVAQVQAAFEVSFARVASDGQEFTSAVTAPSVPATLAPMLVGVNGLQPHLRKHPNLMQPADSTGFVPPFYPSQIKTAYGANTLTQDGTGQTIAIIMSAFPAGNVSTSGNTTFLTNFWTTAGVTRTGTYTALAVGSGPTANASSTDAEEACLDVEWSSSIAPGANIRLYGVGSLSSTDLDTGYQQVYNDVIAHPEFGLHVLSLSYGGSESSPAQLQTDDNLFAQLVSAGVTVFASSGDNGSTGGASSPASDPNVTGVGGTSITMNSTGVVTNEAAWSGSGGNSSSYFSKPSWQTGMGVSGSVSTREVPDVAAPADPGTGALIIWSGSTPSNETVGGTSWSAPTWAGFAALINQARAVNHEQSLGLLNPKIYPLLGTSSFRDITSGSNGGFSAGPGYDMVTGLGVPVFPDLLNQLIQILDPPANVEVNAGDVANFSLIALSSASSFQWQRLPANSSTWGNITNNATYSGATTDILTINATTAAMSGDQFRCIVGSTTTPAATLVVLPQLFYVSTLAGQPGVTGTSDGQGSAAQFNLPNDVALDANGNIFVADTNNDAVRKVTPSGNVTTFAGLPGVPDYVNANGTSARFDFNNSIDFDAGGNIFIADSENNAIRKITSAGNVTTFAGSLPNSRSTVAPDAGNSGTTNGNGTAARFNFPAGLAVATNGTIYVADSQNNEIRKITAAGNVTLLAGSTSGLAGYADGNGTAARFNFPAAIAVDSTGNIFVADANNNVIRKITATGNVTTFAGTSGVVGVADGTGAFAQFNYPSGIAVDANNNLYVTDTNNNSIRKITPAGVVTTVVGQAAVQGFADGVGVAAQFNQPYGVVVNNTTGVIYIADTVNHTVREIQTLVAPQLQSQSGNLTVLAGGTANFSVNATGVPPPAYQWQLLAAGESTWANLTDDDTYNGTATANLTVNATTVDMNGDQFQCLITNAAGNTTSVPVVLTIQSPPWFTTQPADATINSGDGATFTAAATGLPDTIAYQWQMMPAGGAWSDLSDSDTITGSNTTTLSISPANTTLGGAQFRAVASNGISPNATSNAATLTVYPPGYQTWLNSQNLTGANALLTARPFGDAIPNLARFAMNLGASPTSDQLPSVTMVVINNVSYLTLSYDVIKSLSGEQVVAQYSYDLQTWQTVSSGNTVQLTDPNSHTSRFEASVAIPATGTVFLRVVVEPTP